MSLIVGTAIGVGAAAGGAAAASLAELGFRVKNSPNSPIIP